MNWNWPGVVWGALIVIAVVLVAVFVTDADTAKWVIVTLAGIGTAGPGIAKRLPEYNVTPLLPLALALCLPALHGCAGAGAMDQQTIRAHQADTWIRVADRVTAGAEPAVVELVDDGHIDQVARAFATLREAYATARASIRAYLDAGEDGWQGAVGCMADALGELLDVLRASGAMARSPADLLEALNLVDAGLNFVPGGCDR